MIDCLNQPVRDEDTCLDLLSAPQQRSLEDALAVLTTEAKMAGYRGFLEEVEALHATPGPVRDAPECDEYRATMTRVFGSEVACAAVNDVDMFPAETDYERSVRELIALPADRAAEVRAACERGTQALRAGRTCLSLLDPADHCVLMRGCGSGSATSATP